VRKRRGGYLAKEGVKSEEVDEKTSSRILQKTKEKRRNGEGEEEGASYWKII